MGGSLIRSSGEAVSLIAKRTARCGTDKFVHMGPWKDIVNLLCSLP